MKPTSLSDQSRSDEVPLVRSKPSVSISSERHGPLLRTTLTLALADLPEAFDGYRILQLTDLHFGPVTPRSLIEDAIALGQQSAPDLIVLTGDYVQISSTGAHHILATRVHPRMFRWVEYRRQVREYTEQLAEMLAPLTAPDGRIGIFGNHDYTEGIGTIKRKLGTDIRWLVNEQLLLSRNGQTIAIAGTDDHRYGSPDLSKTLAADRPSGGARPPCILLAHNPDVVIFRDNHLLEQVDVVLSGHTHGGQICLPGVRPLVTRTRQKTHVRGLSWFRGTPIYVANGVGFGGVRFRSFCPAEIVVVELRKTLL